MISSKFTNDADNEDHRWRGIQHIYCRLCRYDEKAPAEMSGHGYYDNHGRSFQQAPFRVLSDHTCTAAM